MNSISIVTYNINNEKHPFVTFGLNLLEELDFPIIELDEEIPYNEKDEYIISLTEDYLKTVLSNYRDVSMIYKDEFYDEESKSLILYFEVFMDHSNSYILSRATKIWFATIHEIINTNKFCEFNISQNVVKRIKSKIEDFSEFIPRICYDGGKMEKILFESLFGSSKRDEGYGYVYHFYEYSEAIERAEKDRSNSKTKSSGILRYVIFEDHLTTDSYDMFLPLTVHKI